jgi:polyhydroxybutyrate depolymerase
MRNIKTLFLAFAAIVILASQPQVTLAKQRYPAPTTTQLSKLGFTELKLDVDGVERWFLVLPPRDASKPAPILVFLHGGTQGMRRVFADSSGATLGLPALARRENALLLVPNAVNSETGDAKGDDQNWNDLRENVSRDSSADDVGFILKLLDWAAQNYNVDAKRTYVAGASNGGMMTFRLLIEAPERFAAGAAFVAALPVESSLIKAPSKPTPLMIANGTVDPLVNYEGGKIPGGRGLMRPVAESIDWWIAANKAETKPSRLAQIKDRDPGDNCIIERKDFKAKEGGAPVVTYTMIGGGHNIPSAKFSLPNSWAVRRFIGPVCRDVEGIELIWSFLSGFKR